jgi:hypothetical protein
MAIQQLLLFSRKFEILIGFWTLIEKKRTMLSKTDASILALTIGVASQFDSIQRIEFKRSNVIVETIRVGRGKLRQIYYVAGTSGIGGEEEKDRKTLKKLATSIAAELAQIPVTEMSIEEEQALLGRLEASIKSIVHRKPFALHREISQPYEFPTAHLKRYVARAPTEAIAKERAYMTLAGQANAYFRQSNAVLASVFAVAAFTLVVSLVLLSFVGQLAWVAVISAVGPILAVTLIAVWKRVRQ